MDYVVQKGDTVYGISKRYHLTIADLKAANPGDSIAHNRLSVGQHLRVPTYNNISTIAPVVSPKKVALAPPTTPSIPPGIQNENEPKRTGTPRYLFIDRIMPQLEAPVVVPNRWKYIVVHHS